VSGIAGIVHFRGEAPDRDQARQLSAGVAHRGPDAKGVFADGPAVLAHRRLRIGRGAATQPLSHRHLVSVFDGRLYVGSPQTVIEAWADEGAACLARLRGDFALAVWDRSRRVLWLARDATGTRPLFWSRRGGQFAFCSELPPLLGLPWISREIATDHLAEYLSFRYVHAPRTLLRDVSSVPPGHVLRIDASGERLSRWWRAPWAQPGAAPDKDEVVERLDHLLQKSVQKRLAADAPVGLLLSGGLDSSAILHHAAQGADTPQTFTVSLAEDDVDEAPFAARVAKVMGADHHQIQVSDRRFIDALSYATAAMGLPLPTAAGAVQALLFAELRGSVKVILSGDGGDELLGGRGMEQIAARIRRARAVERLPGPARLLSRTIARQLGHNDWGASTAHFGMERAIGGSRVFHSAERVNLLADPGVVRPGIRRTVLEPLYQEVDSDPINNILHVWQRGWLAEDSLARSDRMAAAAGIEVRYPMLDGALLSFCAQLPGTLKVYHRLTGGYTTKWPLRAAMEERLPSRLLNRPKRSLPNPLDLWLRAPGADFLRGQVDSLRERGADLFIPGVVHEMARQHLEGKANHGLRLWTLILFHIWRREVLRH
jgi:asparagine synthase (glutamine-hydrolysing)